jgi:hypothetical protein
MKYDDIDIEDNGFCAIHTRSSDTRLTQEISDAALRDGMKVRVNGKEYLGAKPAEPGSIFDQV